MKDRTFWLYIVSVVVYVGALSAAFGTAIAPFIRNIDFIGRIVEGPMSEMCCLFVPLTAPVSIGILFLFGHFLLRRLSAKS